MRLFYSLLPTLGIAKQVLTSNGEITGHYASKSPTVLEWLGIPYAQPPVGELRFAPPVGLNDTRSFIADNYGCDCLYPSYGQVAYPNKTAQFDRVFDEFSYVNNNTQSEDCLTLNIWAKPSSALKPVYVHFYGGRWTRGSSNTTFYYGGYFADAQDIIVVTVNYRFNIFGFPGIPNHPPNPGLLDQRLAVEWVKRNIRSFGGDPERIVISGQSVGGTSVDYWAYAYADDPIVKGLISHSGTALSFPISSPEEAAGHWYDVSEMLGCGSQGDVVSCMKRQNATDIINAAAKVKVAGDNPARKAPAFQPTVDNVTVFANYTHLSSRGKFARIPYLVGHTSNEAGFYKVTTYAAGVTLPSSEWKSFNTDTFYCPSNIQALHRAHFHVPVWRFEYHADWANTRLYPGSGSYHGVDFHMLFGASEDISGLAESSEERELKGVMQDAWGRFIADPVCGLDGLGWPQFGDDEVVVNLGVGNRPVAEFERADEKCS